MVDFTNLVSHLDFIDVYLLVLIPNRDLIIMSFLRSITS